MLRRLVQMSLQLRILVAVLAAGLLYVGVTQLRTMPVNVYPEFNPPMVEVQTEALGLSAAEVESLITVPMEADLLNGVAWLEHLYSESVSGLSSILLVFEPGTDPIRARQMVQERLTQAHALPNVSTPPTMLQPLSATGRVMMVGLSSKDLSLIDLGVLARWTVKPRLMGVPGVANVAVWGQRERQLQVQVDPVRLHDNGVTLNQIIKTTGEALWVSPLSFLESSKPGTGGWIDTPNQRLGIRHLLPISSAEDLAQVAVVNHEGMLLGDVANVVEDSQPLIGEANLKDGPGLLLVIEKFPGANVLEVTKSVEAALEALRPGLTGVTIDTTIFRPANYIEQSVSNLSTSVGIGAVLALLILGLLLWSWRTMLVSIVTIPLSLIAATLVIRMLGASFNVMVLAGLAIALGVIIDDTVSAVENIERRLHLRRTQGSEKSTAAIVLEAVLEMRGAIAFATLILLAAITPLFFMEGLTGGFMRPMVLAYGLAVLASMLVTVLIVPGLSLVLLSNASGAHSESPQVRGLQKLYGGFVATVVRAPLRSLAVSAVIAVAGLALIPTLQQSLLPALKQPDLLIAWDGPPGTSSSAMNRITAQVSQELAALPEIRNVGSHTGRAITGDQIVGVNSAELWVSIDPAADYDASVAKIHEVTDGYTGVFREVQTYQPERIGEALGPAGNELIVRVYGVDLDTLRQKAEEVSKALAGLPGVTKARTDPQPVEPEVEIEVNLAAAEKYGVKPGDVRRAVTTMVSGIQVGSLFEEQKVFEVIVLGVPEARSTISDLQNTMIDLPSGDQIALRELADVRIVPSPVIIKRDAVSRYMDVDVTIRGGNVNGMATTIRQRLQGIDFPLEYRAEVLNASLAQQSARQRMWSLVIAALIGIYLLFQSAVGGWRLAFAVVVSLLVALAGGVIAAVVSGGVVTLGALFGFLAILGIAVRNSLMTIDHYRQLELREGEAFGPELLQRGARERLGPVLMTAFATAGALLPLVFFGTIPGHELLRPMAIVILGGLVTSTWFSLFVVPALYARFRAEPDLETLRIAEAPSLGVA